MKEEYLIGLLSLWIVVMILQSFVHHYAIVIEKTSPHGVQWFIIRGMLFILHGVCFSFYNMSEYLPLFLFQASTHMVIFGPLLNKLRKLSFFYLGKDSGWFDRFFVDRLIAYKVFYFVMVLIALFSIHLCYKSYL